MGHQIQKKRRRRALLVSLATVGVTAGVAGGAGTFAAFTDTEQVRGSFSAGTFDLTVDPDANGPQAPRDSLGTPITLFAYSEIVPGWTSAGAGAADGWRAFSLVNSGSISGHPTAEGVALTEEENGRYEAEVEAGDTTDATGELGEAVTLELGADSNCDGTVDGAVVTKTLRQLTPAVLTSLLPASLPAGSSACVRYRASVPADMGNRIISDTAQLDVTFQLSQ